MLAYIQQIADHLPALVAFLLKLSAITLWGVVLRRKIPDRIGAWLHAWLAVQCFQTAALIVLSVPHAITGATAWGVLIATFASSCIAFARRDTRCWPERRSVPFGLLLAIPLAIWVWRCLILPDFSLDAQAYGTLRVAVWMNYRTLFVHMPTVMMNIFADEWNGELNGLLYALAAGNIQGVMMGNAEVLIVAALASTWCARRFGANYRAAVLVGLLVATSPAFIGLGAVTKGDLMSCVGVIVAMGLLVRPNARSFLLACVWLSLAAGAKISVTVGAATTCATFAFTLRRQLFTRELVPHAVLTTLASLLFVSRYIANQIQFGNAFLRVGAEHVEPGMRTLVANLIVIGERFLGFFPVWDKEGHVFATSLSAGLGVAGWVALAGATTACFRPPRSHVLIVGLCFATTVLAGYLIPPRVWGFRYFLPFVSVVAIVFLANLVNAVLVTVPHRQKTVVALVVLAASIDFIACFTPGDLTAPGTFWGAVGRVEGKSALLTSMSAFPDWVNEVDPAKFRLDAEEPKRVAVLNDLSTPVLLFVGSHAQNRLYFARDRAGLVLTAEAHYVDMIVISRFNSKHKRSFPVPGYTWVIDGDVYSVAVRNSSLGWIRHGDRAEDIRDVSSKHE